MVNDGLSSFIDKLGGTESGGVILIEDVKGQFSEFTLARDDQATAPLKARIGWKYPALEQHIFPLTIDG